MDNPITLLVSIMFVTILALAIGNVLMVCADIAGGLRKPLPQRIQLSWMVLMLFVMLNLFWETTALLEVTEWLFIEFLYVISGPMLLLFATSVITAPSQDGRSGDAHGGYFALCNRFFIMLALQEAWTLGIDYGFETFNTQSILSIIMLVLFLILSVSRNLRTHVIGATLAWAGYIVSIVLQTIQS